MVEQKPKNVIDNLRYLPDILEKEFGGMDLSPDLSVNDCWDCMVHTLLTPKLEPFWAHCGFTDPKTVTALLSALRSAVLTACIYYGVDYQYDCQSDNKESTYFQSFGFPYMKRLFGENFFGFSASPWRLYFNNSSIEYKDIRRKFETGLSNAASIYDPLAINPLLIKRQREDYASKKNGKTLTGYFPEIDLFLRKVCGNIVPEARESEGKKLNGWLRYDEGSIRFHTPLWAVFFLLAYHGKYLPGHKNTDQGGVTLYAPSLEVQDFMKNDVTLFADAVLYEPNGEVHFPAMQRVLSVSSIVFPSLVCIFSRLLYLQKGQISLSLVDERLSRISSDNLISKLESSFARKEKTWDDPLYFCKGIKYTQGHKNGEQIKFSYRGQNDFPSDYSAGTIKAADRKLPSPDNLLLTMMKQDLLKNGTIIMQNQINTNVPSALYGWETASKKKCDEEVFLLGMILHWLKKLEIYQDPPERIDM